MAHSKAPKWDDDLTGVALNIAGCNEVFLRVLAGPGTGKTYAMKRRVMRLLQEDEIPHRILACTFTRTAAKDIRKEIGGLGIEGAEKVWAGTLHSLCFSILQKQEVFTATGRVVRPLAESEKRFLLEDLKEGFGGVKKAENHLDAFEAAWARLQSDEPGWPTDKTDKAFQKALLSWLRFHQAILIGEIIPVTLRYMRDNPTCPERTRFDHVIVDEYQDLNRAEQMLVDLLADQAMLSVIGDEDQSIYSFKHAHWQGIVDFADSHQVTHDETLDVCRRCPTIVVKMANSLIENNDSASGRPLKPRKENGPGTVRVVQWGDLEAESTGVADYVLQRIENDGVKAGEVLILAPRRQLGYAVRDALRGLGVVTHSFFNEEALDGNPKRIDDCPAQQAYALLTLLADPEDRVSLRAWCGFGSASLNEGGWTKVREHCEENGETPREVMEKLVNKTLKIAGTTAVVKRFNALLEREEELGGLSGHALAEALFPEGEEWTELLRRIVLDRFKPNVGFTVGQLLEEVRTGVTQAETPTKVEYVRVMSLHKSKGLTAQVVIVLGCIEGLIPRVDYDVPPAVQKRVLEEQRRLFYVALTRTTETLVLSSVTYIPMHTAYKMRLGSAGAQASQFMAELGPNCPAAIKGQALLGE